MPGAVSRRALFARFRGGPVQLRPPWAVGEVLFTDRCTQCGACRDSCPTGLITNGHAGYPIVDFTAASCSFCGACREICEADCFDPVTDEPWGLKAAVSTSCVETKGVACRVCQDGCDANAIRFKPAIGGRSEPWIDEDDCTGCGVCLSLCPVSAITISHPRPETAETAR